MGLSLTYKILKNHLVEGTLAAGQEIGIRIDQCLTQDAPAQRVSCCLNRWASIACGPTSSSATSITT